MTSAIQRPPRVLRLGALLFCVLVMVDSWFRWATFQYTTFDLAFYVQALSQALKGQWQVSLLDVPLMGNHAEPITFLLLPLYALWRQPMLFVLAQTLALASLPFTAWRICRYLKFGEKTSLWFSLATLLAPATGFIALHEFHPEAFAAPFLLLLIEARLTQRLGKFWLWFVAVLACKENLALVLIMWCATQAFQDRTKGRRWQFTWSFAPMTLACIWFTTYSMLIAPSLNGGRVDYLELYSHLPSPGQAPIAFLQLAISAASKAAISGNLIMGLLGPFLFLSLLRPRWLLIAAPIFAQHLLSWRPSEWSIQYHYAAPLLPLMWFAAVEAATKLSWSEMAGKLMVAACLIGQAWFGPVRHLAHTASTATTAWETSEWKEEMLASIPSEASVMAGMPYLSHLADRGQLYSLHHLLKGLRTLSRTAYTPPPPPGVIIVDSGDLSTLSREAGYFHPAMRTSDGRIIPSSDQLLHDYLRKSQWQVNARNEFTLFTQKAGETTAKNPGAAGVIIDANTTLAAIQPCPPAEGDQIQLILTWEFGPERNAFPWVMLFLRGKDGNSISIGKGPALPGVDSGQFAEAWSIRLPSSLPPGDYEMLIRIYDPHETQGNGGEPQFPPHLLDLGEFTFSTAKSGLP